MDQRTGDLFFLDLNDLSDEEQENIHVILYGTSEKSDSVEFPWDNLKSLSVEDKEPLGTVQKDVTGGSTDLDVQNNIAANNFTDVDVNNIGDNQTTSQHNNVSECKVGVVELVRPVFTPPKSAHVSVNALRMAGESPSRSIYNNVPLTVDTGGLMSPPHPYYVLQSTHGQPPINIMSRPPVAHVQVPQYGPPMGIHHSVAHPYPMLGQVPPPGGFIHALPPRMVPINQPPPMLPRQALLPQCLPTSTIIIPTATVSVPGHKLYEKTYERRNKKRRPPGYYNSETGKSEKFSSGKLGEEYVDVTFGSVGRVLEETDSHENSDEMMGNESEQNIVVNSNFVVKETELSDFDNRTECESYTNVSIESNITLESQAVNDDDNDNDDSNAVNDDSIAVIVSNNVVDLEFGFNIPEIAKTQTYTSGEKFVLEIGTKDESRPNDTSVTCIVRELITDDNVKEDNVSQEECDVVMETVPTPADDIKPESGSTPTCDAALSVNDAVSAQETSDNSNDNSQTQEEDNTPVTAAASQGQKDNAVPAVSAAPPSGIPKVSSWAGLFKSANTSSPNTVVHDSTNPVGLNNADSATCNNIEQNHRSEDVEHSVIKVNSASSSSSIGRTLCDYAINHRTSSIQPRGLINRANWCYINATLQALLACPPFFNLMKTLPSDPPLSKTPSATPIVDSLAQFVGEFSLMPQQKGPKGKRTQDINPGTPFEPGYVYTMLQAIQSNQSFKQGRQEDAEEFLSCVLNGLHEEMLAAMNGADGSNNGENVTNGYIASDTAGGDDEGEDEEWQQVGPKNKSVVTRSAKFVKTPISEIFGGQIRSALYKSGMKESATLQPFFTLQLDIQSDKVWNLQDALDGFVSKEAVQGMTCAKTKMEIEATRRVTLEELPPVLILHLKCFVYDKSGGCQKVVKRIEYAENLDISKELLSPNVRSKLSHGKRNYKLFAVVYHHGNKACGGGHYTADIYHSGINGWLRMDDSRVKVVTYQQVQKFVSPKVPYILYYRRCDLL